jgi:hypothetical protein
MVKIPQLTPLKKSPPVKIAPGKKSPQEKIAPEKSPRALTRLWGKKSPRPDPRKNPPGPSKKNPGKKIPHEKYLPLGKIPQEQIALILFLQ